MFVSLVFFLLTFVTLVTSIFEWSYQQRLIVSEANVTYGLTPSFLTGRGFRTMITGYDSANPGVYVHTTDTGQLKQGHEVWSQQAKLVAVGAKATDHFGKWMVSFNQTLIISSPSASNNRGFVYVFNGTRRHWSQVQRLVAFDGSSGDYFGECMALHNDRLIIGARGQLSTAGAAFVYERTSGSILWSRQAKLVAADSAVNQFFGERVALYGDSVAIIAHNDDYSGSQTGSAYIFTGKNLIIGLIHFY